MKLRIYGDEWNYPNMAIMTEPVFMWRVAFRIHRRAWAFGIRDGQWFFNYYKVAR